MVPAVASVTPDNQILFAKVLLLGAAESGKSTLCRHIRLLYGEPLGEDEILHLRHNIRTSCLEYLTKMLSDCIDQNKIPAEHQEACKEFLEQSKSNCNRDRQFLDKSVAIWRNSSLQRYILEMKTQQHFATTTSGDSDDAVPSKVNVKKNQGKLHSDHPAHHFLPSFARIMSEGYYPISDDILSLRIPTTGKAKAVKCYLSTNRAKKHRNIYRFSLPEIFITTPSSNIHIHFRYCGNDAYSG